MPRIEAMMMMCPAFSCTIGGIAQRQQLYMPVTFTSNSRCQTAGSRSVRPTKVSGVGTIAGCYVVEGEIHRDDKVRIVRDGTVIFEGHMASLRRFKDDVKSVKQGYECGIGIEKFQDLKVGDTIEGYVVKEVERTE